MDNKTKKEILEHKAFYEEFIKYTIYTAVTVIVIVVLMAIFLI